MNLNTEVFYLINNGMSNPVFDFIMPIITNLGGLAFIAIMFAILLIVCRKNIFNLGKYYGLVKVIALAIILTVIIAAPLKLLFSQPRPGLVLSNVHVLTSSADPNSFPSGHSATTASVVTATILKSKEYFEKYKLINIGLVAFLIVIAFSRIYIGMHFPFDVLVGCAIGIVSGVLAVKILKV